MRVPGFCLRSLFSCHYTYQPLSVFTCIIFWTMKQVALLRSLIVMLSSLWWSKNVVCKSEIRPSTLTDTVMHCTQWSTALRVIVIIFHNHDVRRQHIDLSSNEHQSFRSKIEQCALSCVARKTCLNRTLDQKPVRHHESPPSWESLICGGSTGECFDEERGTDDPN